jgi:lactosylceramide 4-alpha-galactosyltransferase
LDDLFKGLPIEQIYKEKVYEKSPWPYMALGDMIRLACVYKMGGMYVDLDYFFYKPLDVEGNFGAREDDSTINISFLRFDKKHPLLWKVMEEIKNNLWIPNWGGFGFL